MANSQAVIDSATNWAYAAGWAATKRMPERAAQQANGFAYKPMVFVCHEQFVHGHDAGCITFCFRNRGDVPF